MRLLTIVFLILFFLSACSNLKTRKSTQPTTIAPIQKKSTKRIIKKTTTKNSNSSNVKNAIDQSPIMEIEIEISGCGLEGSIESRVKDCNKTVTPRETSWSLVMQREEVEKDTKKTPHVIEIWRDDADYPPVYWTDIVKLKSSFNEAQEVCKNLFQLSEYSDFETIHWTLPTFDTFGKGELHGIREVLARNNHIFWTSTFATRSDTYLYGGKDGSLSKGAADSNSSQYSVRCVGAE